MKKVFIAAVLIAGLTGSSSAWALFETKTVAYRHCDAGQDRSGSVGGCPWEGGRGGDRQEVGQTVYKVEIVNGNKTRKVYVDAQTLEVRIDK